MECQPMDLSVPSTGALSKSCFGPSLNQADSSRVLKQGANCNESLISRKQTNQQQLNQERLVVIASTSSQHIKSIKIPSKRKSLGRFKGVVNNVIGLRKIKKVMKTKVTISIKTVKFVRLISFYSKQVNSIISPSTIVQCDSVEEEENLNIGILTMKSFWRIFIFLFSKKKKRLNRNWKIKFYFFTSKKRPNSRHS